jgi:hypothetical protein
VNKTPFACRPRTRAHRRACPGAPSRLLAASITLLLATPALPQSTSSQSLIADEGVARVLDAFNPYVALGLGYDSNIYRLDDDAPEIGDTMADQYVTLAAGFESRLERVQQSFDINAEISRSLFMEHDELDYTGSKANAVWHWVASESTRGDLGVRHRRSLRDFANQSSFERDPETRMENALFASGEFSLPAQLTAEARADFADISFSETDRLDLQRLTVGGALGRATVAGNWFGLDGEYIQGSYDENPAADFDEYTVGPRVEWRTGARTQLTATVGYTSRMYDTESRQDYDGATGRLALEIEDDERNGLSASVYRELSNLGDEIADFAIVDGIIVEPRFRIRDNFDLRFVAGYERRDFQRDPLDDFIPVPVDADREDDVYTAGAFVDWDVHKNVRVSIGADMQRRDSTRALQDYDFARFEIRITGHL